MWILNIQSKKNLFCASIFIGFFFLLLREVTFHTTIFLCLHVSGSLSLFFHNSHYLFRKIMIIAMGKMCTCERERKLKRCHESSHCVCMFVHPKISPFQNFSIEANKWQKNMSMEREGEKIYSNLAHRRLHTFLNAKVSHSKVEREDLFILRRWRAKRKKIVM